MVEELLALEFNCFDKVRYLEHMPTKLGLGLERFSPPSPRQYLIHTLP